MIIVGLISLFICQGFAMLIDEFYFHRRRGLGAWERWGHPIDTLSVLLGYGLALTQKLSTHSLIAFTVVASCSCLLVTKDEFVHAKECGPTEHWLHAVLFILHPLTFIAVAAIAWIPSFQPAAFLLNTQFTIMACFCLYQIIYWNVIYVETPTTTH